MISLNIKTDSSQLNNLIDVLTKYQGLKDTKVMQKIVDRGVELLKEEASRADFKFGEGRDIINGMYGVVESPTSGYIANDSGKMAFVEFGTGLVGQGTSGFDTNALGWKYAVDPEKGTGWWYPVDSQPPKGQPQYFDEITGQWYAFTKGQEAKNIFYNATQRLQKELPTLIVDNLIHK